jgi:hypothetical protein
MKKQKKFGRKLALNKQTIARLGQEKVLGGATGIVTECIQCPCGQTVPTETACSNACPTDTCYCITINNCPTNFTCETCDTCLPICTLNTDSPTDCKPLCQATGNC